MRDTGTSQTYEDDPKAVDLPRRDHEREIHRQDTIVVFGVRVRVHGMVGLGMPLREVTLHVEQEPGMGCGHGSG